MPPSPPSVLLVVHEYASLHLRSISSTKKHIHPEQSVPSTTKKTVHTNTAERKRQRGTGADSTRPGPLGKNRDESDTQKRAAAAFFEVGYICRPSRQHNMAQRMKSHHHQTARKASKPRFPSSFFFALFFSVRGCLPFLTHGKKIQRAPRLLADRMQAQLGSDKTKQSKLSAEMAACCPRCSAWLCRAQTTDTEKGRQRIYPPRHLPIYPSPAVLFPPLR